MEVLNALFLNLIKNQNNLRKFSFFINYIIVISKKKKKITYLLSR